MVTQDLIRLASLLRSTQALLEASTWLLREETVQLLQTRTPVAFFLVCLDWGYKQALGYHFTICIFLLKKKQKKQPTFVEFYQTLSDSQLQIQS